MNDQHTPLAIMGGVPRVLKYRNHGMMFLLLLQLQQQMLPNRVGARRVWSPGPNLCESVWLLNLLKQQKHVAQKIMTFGPMNGSVKPLHPKTHAEKEESKIWNGT